MGNGEMEGKMLKLSIDYYEDIGRWADVSRIRLRLGRLFHQLGMTEKARENLENGLKVEQIHRKRLWRLRVKRLSRTELEIHDELANLSEDVEESLAHRELVIKELEKKNDHTGAAIARLKYIFDLHDAGILQKALDELDDLEEYLTGSEDWNGVIACELERSRVCMDMGKYQKASKILNDVISKANKIGDVEGLRCAKTLLDKVNSQMRPAS